MKKLTFEDGKEYERLDKAKSDRLIFGWTCTVAAFLWLFSVWGLKERIGGFIFMLIFGLVSLSLGYSYKKQLRKYQ